VTAIDGGLAVAIAVALAAGLEVTVGEPPASLHPVAALGRVIERLDSRRFGTPRLVGTGYALAVPIGFAALAYAAVRLAASVPIRPATALVAGLVLWVTSSARMLVASGRSVIEASDEPNGEREALPALVGRETGDLSPELVRSAATESLAENLSDGLVGPLLAFVALSVVSLPAAGAGAAFLKAANTMDSMLGYPGSFGWASARLDDLLMFVPARLSAMLVAIAAGAPGAPLRARRYVHTPASPNAGWPMGTIAAALDVRLEKPGAYVLNDTAPYPTVADGREALAVIRRSAAIAYAAAIVFGGIRWL
jgi:adenosylcobinamide-phosphate synthase